jgi:hypothetical protein
MLELLRSAAPWFETSAIGLFVRESLWGFPIVVAVHILSLAISIGLLLWFDLRLVGIGFVRSSVSVVYRRLLPWSSVAFVTLFASGAMLFTGFASAALKNEYFAIKMTAIVLAAVNAAFYHLTTERGIVEWDEAARPPLAARLAGFFSLLLWAVVILCGRMMSYTMF